MNLSGRPHPVAEFGGRLALMDELEGLAARLGLQTLSYAGISAGAVERAASAANAITGSGPIPWAGRSVLFKQLVEREAGPMWASVPALAVKSSFVANDGPESLSFAGVGSTVIIHGDRGGVGPAAARVVGQRGKRWAEYYFRSHLEASARDMGLLLMEYLPDQVLWGTAWIGAEVIVTELYTVSEHPQFVHNTFAARDVRSQVLFEDPSATSAAAAALGWLSRWPEEARVPVDIEFCAARRGQVITQWRPIPTWAASRLALRAGTGNIDNCAPPYVSQGALDGRVRWFEREARRPRPERDRGSSRTRGEQSDIWLVHYLPHGTRPGLLDLLEAASTGSIPHLSPVVVLMEPGKPWGHLHAVAAEQPGLGFVGYSKLDPTTERPPWRNGDLIRVRTDAAGWARLERVRG